MPLQIYNNKMPLSSILINIFTLKVQFIDIERDSNWQILGAENT